MEEISAGFHPITGSSFRFLAFQMEAKHVARRALTKSVSAASGSEAEISRTSGRQINGRGPEKLLIVSLSKSNVFREYEQAFVAATGLPLSLHAPDMMTVIRHSRRQESPF